jgi:hypothetical protein
MDWVALLQAEAGEECTRIHHLVQKDGHHVGYLSQEPKFTPQVSGGFTQSSMKSGDSYQDKDNG